MTGLTAIVAAALFAAGAVPTRAAPDSAYTVTYDTTYYVSNRARSGARFSRGRSDTLEYGYVVTRFRERITKAGDSPWLSGFSARQGEPVRLSRDEFIARVRATDARARAGEGGPVVYVHGYAVSFRRAITQGSEISHRGRFGGAFVVFAWPAHRAITTWPTPSALISRAYRDDSASAAASTAAFRAAIGDLMTAVTSGRLTIVGHSLGAQLAAEALAEPSALRDSLRTAPLRALALFAPDIATAHFRDVLDAALIPVATRRVIYASQVDRMLMFSRMINGTARAGQAGRERLLADATAEVVDVTRGRRATGVLLNLVEPRHAMRYAGTALRDFFGVVRGAGGECRADDGLAERTGERSWRLTPAAVPARDVACVSVAGAESPARQSPQR